MIRSGRASPAQVTRILEEVADQAVTYAPVGRTLEGRYAPRGYRYFEDERRLGGVRDFGVAVEGLARWAAQKGAEAKVVPDEPPTVGLDVVVLIPFGLLELISPCRVVSLVDEPDRWGFAYGTLPGHSEQGEEAFIVERRPEGTWVVIRAFSRHVDTLARLAGPVGSWVQDYVTKRYISGMTEYVSSGGGPHR